MCNETLTRATHAVNAGLGHGSFFQRFRLFPELCDFARSDFFAFFAVQTAGSQYEKMYGSRDSDTRSLNNNTPQI
jgi:hypothetical protein